MQIETFSPEMLETVWNFVHRRRSKNPNERTKPHSPWVVLRTGVLSLERLTGFLTEALSKEPCIARAWLFGSYAKGKQTCRSDVDLLVEFDPIVYPMGDPNVRPSGRREPIDLIEKRIETVVRKIVSILDYNDYMHSDLRLKGDVEKTKILVYERPEGASNAVVLPDDVQYGVGGLRTRTRRPVSMNHILRNRYCRLDELKNAAQDIFAKFPYIEIAWAFGPHIDRNMEYSAKRPLQLLVRSESGDFSGGRREKICIELENRFETKLKCMVYVVPWSMFYRSQWRRMRTFYRQRILPIYCKGEDVNGSCADSFRYISRSESEGQGTKSVRDANGTGPAGAGS